MKPVRGTQRAPQQPPSTRRVRRAPGAAAMVLEVYVLQGMTAYAVAGRTGTMYRTYDEAYQQACRDRKAHKGTGPKGA